MMSRGRLGGVALVLVLAVGLVVRPARADEPLKPYVLLVLDTSGSMDNATGSGSPSCGGPDTKLNHAKCAINSIANSYGDMILGLGRFRNSQSGTAFGDCAGNCALSGIDCNNCDTGDGTNCTSDMSSDTRLEVLVPLVDGAGSDIATWTDGVCTTCGYTGQPEVFDTAGYTPISGSLKGAKRYFQGLQASDGTNSVARGHRWLRSHPQRPLQERVPAQRRAVPPVRRHLAHRRRRDLLGLHRRQPRGRHHDPLGGAAAVDGGRRPDLPRRDPPDRLRHLAR
ncbi:MAG: VWA domain-containing protein [Kofleriaceae bacterium]